MLAWPIGILPRIRLAGLYRLSDRQFPILYRHRDTVAIHLHGYHARLRCVDGELTLAPGDVTVSIPDAETSYDIPVSGPCWCMHVESPRAAGDGALALPTRIRPRTGERFFADRFARLVGWWSAGAATSAAAEAARAAAYEIIAAIAAHRRDGDSTAAAEGAVERATAWLTAHYRDEVSIAQLCRRLHARQDRLSAAFKRRHGCSMLEFIARKRIEHAQLLVETTELPMAAIAGMAGFADRRYFTRLFHRVTGVQPSSLRRSRLGTRTERRPQG